MNSKLESNCLATSKSSAPITPGFSQWSIDSSHTDPTEVDLILKHRGIVDYMDEMSFEYIVGSNGSVIHSESDDRYDS